MMWSRWWCVGGDVGGIFNPVKSSKSAERRQKKYGRARGGWCWNRFPGAENSIEHRHSHAHTDTYRWTHAHTHRRFRSRSLDFFFHSCARHCLPNWRRSLYPEFSYLTCCWCDRDGCAGWWTDSAGLMESTMHGGLNLCVCVLVALTHLLHSLV